GRRDDVLGGALHLGTARIRRLRLALLLFLRLVFGRFVLGRLVLGLALLRSGLFRRGLRAAARNERCGRDESERGDERVNAHAGATSEVEGGGYHGARGAGTPGVCGAVIR